MSGTGEVYFSTSTGIRGRPARHPDRRISISSPAPYRRSQLSSAESFSAETRTTRADVNYILGEGFPGCNHSTSATLNIISGGEKMGAKAMDRFLLMLRYLG